ncbi:MAG: response regulator transcription factor [Nitrospirota bacterium]|nr:response regulator transcription factor [Nitrospirota bacterium]
MRILLVEDEKGVANFIKKGLQEEYYTIDHSIDAEGGLLFLDTTTYDLIILDVMMPGMNGFDLCKKIRQRGVHSPILMLTARDSVKDKVHGLDSGADDYLTKPFSFEEFLARVRALLRRKQDKLTEFVHGALKIDAISHRVYAGGKEIVLRPKEFSILVYLVRNKGRVLSRTQILENIWGYDFNPNTNIVDVHIKALREKLKGYSLHDLIRSVRGVGYMVGD